MDRKGFIGGSDCVRIMEGDWLNLWLVKTGQAESDDLTGNIAVQLGIHTEGFNLDWFEKQYDCILSHHQHEVQIAIGDIPAKGIIDAMWNGLVVEAKHTNDRNNMSSMIERYMPQLQLYLKLTASEGAHLSVIFGNGRWESNYVSYNEDYFNSMWAVVSDFWGYVVRNEQPVSINVPEIKTDKIAVDNMVRRDAGNENEFISKAFDYIKHKDAAKSFETAKADLKAMVGSNEREVYCDILTIKRSKNGSLLFTER